MAYNKPLSYSGMKLYRKCPRAWESAYIHGVRSPSGPAAERGKRIHSIIEHFFLYDSTSPNAVFNNWRDYLIRLKQYDPTPEIELAVRDDWSPCGFNDPEAFIRGLADLRYTKDDVLHIHDWKTGRKYPEHEEQGKVYVALSKADVDQHRKVVVTMDYLDQGESVSWDYKPQEVPEMVDNLIELANEIRADEHYLPTPSMEACQWCDLSWRRGGKCKDAP